MIETLQAFAPAVILIGVASAIYLLGTFVELSTRWWVQLASLAIVISGLSVLLCSAHVEPNTFETYSMSSRMLAAPGLEHTEISAPMFRLDSLAGFGCGLALLTGLAIIVMSAGSCGDRGVPEYFASLLLVVAGGVIVALANDLVLLFLGLELISLPTYVLLCLPRSDAASQESVAKYFFLSVFSSALLLYGLSFIYGAVGSTNLWAVQSVLGAGPAATLADGSLPLALVLVVGGLSFKMAAVPFHFYAPDVYQGTTSPLAGLLAWAPKAAGVIAVLRIVSVAANYEGSPSPWLMALVAAATMFTGNILALLQDNLKRLFAYSSVAQAGYMLIGVGVVCVERTGVRSEEFRITSGYLTNDGSESVLFYLLAYAVMTLGVFAVLTCLSGRGRSAESVHDLAGLGKRHPGVALAMVVFLFSLTGIPLTAGFWGKLALFSSALASGDRLYTYLAVIGVINAVISSYYYLRIIGIMYMHEPSVGEPLQIQQGGAALSVVTACAALTLMIGVLPSPFLASIGDGQSQVSQAVLAIVGGAVAFGALVLLLTLGRERRLT